MEDALVLYDKVSGKVSQFGCLNPCFNGRCTRTAAAAIGVGYLAGKS